VDSEVSEAPDHPNLQVQTLQGKPKVRKNYWFWDLSPNTIYRTHNSNIATVVRAIKERLFFVKTDSGFQEVQKPIRPSIFDEKCDKFRSEFFKHVQYTAPLTEKQFLDSYSGRRRTAYESAFKSLKYKEFSVRDSYISFFVKCEKVNFSKKKDPAPRGISPRSPRYHVKLGPYIKRIEKKIYEVVNTVFGAVTIFKGLNAQASGSQMRAHWDAFDDPIAIPLDASRFDQHVSAEALQYEHSFYNRFYYKCANLAALLRMQLINKGFARCPDGVAKFKIIGGRMSGDMNTGLGNCLLMCAMIYSYCDEANITKFRLANNGDDCVLFVERRDYHRTTNLTSWFLDLGFDMVREPHVEIFEKIEFCQTQPVWTPQGWLMVRQVPTSIAKDCLCLKPLDSEKLFKRWSKTVGECGLSLTGGIPIVQEFYQKLYSTGCGVNSLVDEPTLETGFARLALGMHRKYSEVHPLTRYSFYLAFAVAPAKQLAFEEVYRNKVITYEGINQTNRLASVML
jgi:hypothetical protein